MLIVLKTVYTKADRIINILLILFSWKICVKINYIKTVYLILREKNIIVVIH